MSTQHTSLVDTRLPATGAARAATALYGRLLALDAIERAPRTDIDGCAVAAFAVRAGYTSIALDERIVAIDIRVRDHRWLADALHGAVLVEGGGEHGLFAGDDVNVACPACGFVLGLGGEHSDALEQALEVFTGSADSAYLACPDCAAWTPLQDWRAADHGFAAGTLGITFWGAHLGDLVAETPSTAARLLRTAMGDAHGRFAVVFARG